MNNQWHKFGHICRCEINIATNIIKDKYQTKRFGGYSWNNKTTIMGHSVRTLNEDVLAISVVGFDVSDIAETTWFPAPGTPPDMPDEEELLEGGEAGLSLNAVRTVFGSSVYICKQSKASNTSK